MPGAGQRATIDPTFFTGRRPAPRGPAAGGPPASMFGAGVSMDEQGPTQAGGTLAGITAPGVSRDIIQSRFGPRFDFGPIFRPRSTGANPLTNDPFQATSGVGGFFRRLLGDNADELNAQWQQARIANQLAAQSKADERAFELEKLGKQNEQELERTRYGIEARSNADLAVAAANRAAQQQWEAGAPQRAVAAEHAKATATFGDPILASNYLQSRAQAELERLQSQADLNEAKAFGAEAGGLGLGGRGGRAGAELGWKALGDTGLLTSPEGKLYSRNFQTGALEEVQMPGVGPAAPGGLSEETRAAAREKMAQLKEQSALEAPAQPTSAMSGLGEILGQLPGVAAENPLGAAALSTAKIGLANPVTRGLSELVSDLRSTGGTSDIMEQQQALERKLAKKRNR